MGDGSGHGDSSYSGPIDKVLRSPLYIVGGIVSGTIVTTASNILSSIALFWIKKQTPFLPAPEPAPPSGTPTPEPPTHINNTTLSPGQVDVINISPPSGLSPVLGLAIIILLLAFVLMRRSSAGTGLRHPRLGWGILLGSLIGAVVGLGIGAVMVPRAAFQFAIGLGVLGAAVGDLLGD